MTLSAPQTLEQSIDKNTFPTLKDLLWQSAAKNPQAEAILAPGRKPLTRDRLVKQCEAVVTKLNSIGVGRQDRVAIALPNGPEMGVVFLAVACGATCAPLNPDYRAPEFEFYLSDLNAKALIIQTGVADPAREVATALNIPIIELTPILEEEAGIFTLTGGETNTPALPGFAETNDIGLVLHTSGTTSRPKVVPLTQLNLCTSAKNIKNTLNLTEADRCLNIMPLFHIHGLIAALLSSMGAGGSIVCTPGYYAPKFFGWWEEFKPTWYTAVPTMHQGILARATTSEKIHSPRFLRSSSASLPPQVMAELEATFNAPVIEAYGMTEATHQMASNPLPPADRKPGSVGLAAGPELAIMDDAGNLLKPEETGEVVIKGANVTLGYENNPKANEGAYTNGWFRTGDLGYLDPQGYLFLKGRIKEIINRAGEKISPREVDEVILDHPAVAQVVTFGMPHKLLGEEVAVAVVLKEGKTPTEAEIMEFAAARLANFKIPRKVVFLKEVPKGPTGKIQRIGLAERLGITADEATTEKSEYVAPRTATETELVKIWQNILELPQVGVLDNFFELGGDSMLAATMFLKIEEKYQKRPPLSVMLQTPTVENLAQILDNPQAAGIWESLILIKPGSAKTPLFLVHDADGETFLYLNLARELDPERPVYGLQPLAKEGIPILHTRIEEIATYYIEKIRTVQPQGPYYLGGLCAGGVIAFEMALQLQAQQQKVELVALFDSNDVHAPLKTGRISNQRLSNLSNAFNQEQQKSPVEKTLSLLKILGKKAKNVISYEIGSRVQKNKEQSQVKALRHHLDNNLPLPESLKGITPRTVYQVSQKEYNPEKQFDGEITLFRATTGEGIDEAYINRYSDPLLGWSQRTTKPVKVFDVPGGHSSMLQQPHVKDLGQKLNSCLN